MNRYTKRGDTIVEVLLAIVIVSAVLAGAYASVQRSINFAQDAKERTTANEYAKGQLERLRGIIYSSSGQKSVTLPADNTYFCINDSNAVVEFSAPADVVQPETYPSACKVGQFYRVSIVKSSTPLANTFTVRVLWPSLIGSSSDVNGTSVTGYSNVRVIYRVR